jgi:hypothetical protein
MVEKEKRLNKRQPRLSNTAVKAISENVNLDESKEESTSSEIDCESTTSDTASSNPDANFRPLSSYSRPRSVTLEMNTNLIAKQTGTVALSRGLSIRDHVSMQASFVKAGGGNVNDFVMSVSTTWRHKQKNLKAIYDNIGDEWMKIKPKFSVIHFDSKLIK